jgi:hypothetical protein
MNRFLAFSVASFIACLSISYLLKAEAAAYTSEASRSSRQVDECAPATYWAAVAAAVAE